jgi:hypothetical protein
MARKTLIVLTLVVCALCVGVIFLNWPRGAINPRACARIQIGMTEREVEGILGRPADREYHPWDIATFVRPTPGTDPEWEKAWSEQLWSVFVQFDAQGRVCAKGCMETDFDNPPDGIVFSIRRYLQW